MIIENKIYQSIIGICEAKEHEGVYKGNRHHLAQKLTKAVSIAILPKKKKLIYEILTDAPQSTKEISSKLGMDSKNASSVLIQMAKTTNLVSFTSRGKLKYWKRK